MVSFFLWYTGWNPAVPIRSLRSPALCQPLTNLIPSICRKFRESLAPGLFRLLHPGDLSGEFDLLHGMGRNTKLNWSLLSQGSSDLESETLIGSIYDDSAALRFELDIGEFFRPLSVGTTAFGFHWCSRAPWF